MKTSAPRISRRGFTLIELLTVITVIAIIGILAAILIPVVGKVRATARRSQCASNLRQMGIGIQLYADEHKDTLPYVVNWSAADGNVFWYHLVSISMGLDRDAWLREDGMFDCGAAEISIPHYTMSSNVDARKRSTIRIPSRTVVLADGPGSSGAGINNSPPYNGVDAKRHGNGANYLYLDSHVEFHAEVPSESLDSSYFN